MGRIAQDGLYICSISVHGLIRGVALELGRDADTGGQTKYVVESARALARQPGVERVDLLTRLVDDPRVDADYRTPVELLGDGARIVRIEAGPPAYIPKEELWDYLDPLADNALEHFRASGRSPDLVHSHYADAGYVGVRLASLLGVPLLHTGHSLGRVKRQRLLARGLDAAEIEERYNMFRRIEAEEETLAAAERVIASTRQEIEEQYELYDHYQPDQMRVIPPGTDLEQFHPPTGGERESDFARQIARFLRDPDKPIILSIARPDPRKNVDALITAFGESPALREKANLVVVAGTRDDVGALEDGPREVIEDLLHLVDRYDLYGEVAYPKHHAPEDVPGIYRLAAASRGVFVNPALTEPFGLTLIEAAASGLPIVATEDGGPQDIVANCDNGLLVDPLDPAAIGAALLEVLSDREAWDRRAANGLRGVRRHYSWDAHAEAYLDLVRPIVAQTDVRARVPLARRPTLYRDRALFSDIAMSLAGDPDCARRLARVVREHRKRALFGIATGRRLDAALKELKQLGLPEPDVLITSCGTEIYYAPALTADTAWARHIDHHWTPHVVRRVLADLPGLERQPRSEQSRFKISYYYDPAKGPSVDEINALLRREEQAVHVIVSFGQFLDVLPVRASKGYAVRYVADRRDIPLEHVLVAGGSGSDEDMMRGNTLAVVVANRHDEEVSALTDLERVYFARGAYAAGILEAIEHYDFFGACTVPANGEAGSVA